MAVTRQTPGGNRAAQSTKEGDMKTNYEQHMQELASLVNGLSQAEGG